mmetsp:Transcript_72740/g.194112  ORF Transcript_72740/g.194112 Transcript_72740/m.194112 type:complete len:301 (+) Transcript_72740:746-1648(+)
MRRRGGWRNISLHFGPLPGRRSKIPSSWGLAAALAPFPYSFRHPFTLLVRRLHLAPPHGLLGVFWRRSGAGAGAAALAPPPPGSTTPGSTTSDSTPRSFGEPRGRLAVQGRRAPLRRDELAHEPATLPGDKRVRQQILDGRALLCVLRQELPDQVVQLGGVLLWYGVVLLGHDLVDQAQQIARRKSVLQHAEFVQHASQRPDVRLESVRPVFTNLGRHVVRRPHHGHRLHHRALQDARYPEIPDFHDGSSVGQEDVRGLQIPVQHPLAMHVVQGLHQLDEPAHDRGFGEMLATLLHRLDA